jgi:hypothetical protein
VNEDRDGWWDVPAATNWTCPECGQTSPVEEWVECEPGCEDCGSHDGRRCPRCDETFDHVWGSTKIAEAIERRSQEAL